MASSIPPNAPRTPPRTSDCILNPYTFLPRLRAASSSSRIDRSTRPHGLRISRNVMMLANTTRPHPMVMTHRVRVSKTVGPSEHAQHRAHDHRLQLEPVHVLAQAPGVQFVFPNRSQYPPPWTADQQERHDAGQHY